MSFSQASRILALGLVGAVLPACGNLNDKTVVIPFTFRVSVSSSGAQANAQSGEARLSADGTYVVFSSSATNLIPGGTQGGTSHVYRRNLATSVTDLVSVDTTLLPADEDSAHPSISDDGRYVAFQSLASNLTSTPMSTQHVYVRDMNASSGNGISLVSASAGGTAGNGASSWPEISGDGNFVAFVSLATNFGDSHVNGKPKIYRKARGGAPVIPVSVTPAQGDPAIQLGPPTPSTGCVTPSISRDGTIIAFASDFTDLTADPIFGISIFVATVGGGGITTVLASLSILGGGATGDSANPSLSGDGNFLAFDSIAPDVIPVDNNGGTRDVFRVDLNTFDVVLIDQSSEGLQAELGSDSQRPSISFDGRFVAFDSVAAALVSGDTNLATDVFIRDVVSGTTLRVSVDTSNNPAGSFLNSKTPSLSPDAKSVAFASEAPFVRDDTNGVFDVYVRSPLR